MMGCLCDYLHLRRWYSRIGLPQTVFSPQAQGQR